MKTAFTEFWTVFRPYWASEERRFSAFLLASVVALNLGSVYILVLINQWYALFYNSLQERDFSVFVYQLGRFALLAGFYIAAAVYRTYFRQMLDIRWRNWLTRRYVGRWLGNDAYYRMQLENNAAADNPDQRISEDINTFVNQTLVLGLGFLEALVTLASFAVILWSLSGSVVLWGFSIPGYMLWAAIVYAVLGSWLAHRIGLPLVSLNYRQQLYEANLRFALVRVRENAEQIALYRGQGAEQASIGAALTDVVRNWWDIMRRQKLLTWFSSSYSQIATIFPFVVAAPRYFFGGMQLGGLMQTASAFEQVQTALSWFITNYTSFAEWKATLNRLTGFESALAAAGHRPPPKLVVIEAPGATAISVCDLNIHLPDGSLLLKDLSFVLPQGARVLIAGPSGSGKSTLLRTLCGIWPYCDGRIVRPAGQRLLFCPQKPYLPLGTLRAAVSYPDSASAHGDADILAVLEQCGLKGLSSRLDERENWAVRFSPGEQQRLAFARALLIRPQWLFLDEATSALDDEAEAMLYGLVAALAQCAIVSVAHRKTLAAFHTRTIVLARTLPTPAREQPASRLLTTFSGAGGMSPRG